MNEIKEKYEKILMDATMYSGSLKKGDKVISASSLSEPLLPTYLKIKYGVKDQSGFEQNTIGSLYQLGIDAGVKNHEDIVSALRLEADMDDGWRLSGEIDQLMKIDIDDVPTLVIIDNKLVKHNTLARVRKEGTRNGYFLQLRAYKWLIQNCYSDYNDEPIVACLSMAFKDGSYFTKTKVPNSIMEEVDLTKMTDEEIVAIIIERAGKIQDALNDNYEPPKCDNLFWSRAYKPARPMKCIKFCNVNNSCSHYKKYKKGQEGNSIKKLLNL